MATTGARLRTGLATLQSWLGRGKRHRRRLQAIDTRIVVSGVRGKTTVTRWLHERFSGRGYDTYSKTTGTEPFSWTNGTAQPIDRSGRITLYENEREIGRYRPEDVLILENHGIREYTTRLVNSCYVDPTVVVLTNVRQDHLDTLGTTVREIAQALSRSVPAGTTVLTGERNPAVTDYLAAELADRDATLELVEVPDAYADVPGAEDVFLLDAVLEAVGEPPIDEAQREAYLDELRVDWTELPAGRVYNAAEVNDVESTERVRQALMRGTAAVIQPLVYLRRDRPGRTMSFISYLNRLYDQGAIEKVRVVGDHQEIFEHRTDCRTIHHDEDREPPAEVLDAALADGQPVVLMGNTVTPFMEALQGVIAERSEAVAPAEPTIEPEAVSVLTVAAGYDSVAPQAVLDRIDRYEGELDRLLVVSPPESPTAPIEAWDAFGTDAPARYTRIAVGEGLRSASAAAEGVAPLPAEGEVVVINDPGAVDELRDRIEAWIEAGVPGEEAVVVVPSVDWLVEVNGHEDARAVLAAVVDRLREVGVHGVFRLDPKGMAPGALAEAVDRVERFEADAEGRDPEPNDGR